MSTAPLDEIALAVVCDIADQLEYSWNTADGPGFAEPFADDADVVTSQGLHLTDRQQIGADAVKVLAGGVRGDRDDAIALRVLSVRCTSATTFVSLIELIPRGCSGPTAERIAGLATVVISATTRGWEVTNLHNTSRTGA